MKAGSIPSVLNIFVTFKSNSFTFLLHTICVCILYHNNVHGKEIYMYVNIGIIIETTSLMPKL